jgi:hypothetical protein
LHYYVSNVERVLDAEDGENTLHETLLYRGWLGRRLKVLLGDTNHLTGDLDNDKYGLVADVRVAGAGLGWGGVNIARTAKLSWGNVPPGDLGGFSAGCAA